LIERDGLVENDGYTCEIVRRALQYHGGEEMSRRNFHAFAWPVLAPLCGLLVVAIALFAGCDDKSEDGYDYFLRDVAAMQELGLPVYWLGREFNAGGLTFQGPYGVGFGREVEGGGIFMQYISWLSGARGGSITSLEVTVYSRSAWDLVKDAVGTDAPGVTHKVVRVGDRDGEVILQGDAARPLNALSLVLDLENVVVVARAHSVLAPAARGGGELTPFINDPDLLVQVMQDLRPYPE
jgi:hypothetical protein